MALDKITTAIIADDAVTAAKIVAGAVGTSEIADGTVVAADIGADAVGTTELANDVTISTSGNIATTGSGTLTVAGTSTLTGNATASGNLTVTGDLIPSGHPSKNLLINGAMEIRQRADASGVGASNTYCLDRWTYISGHGTPAQRFSLSKQLLTSGSPLDDGFSNYQVAHCSTAETNLGANANRYSGIFQKIEYKSLHHLKWGTGSAKDLTISFWVKSTQTGNHGIVFFMNGSSGIALPRTYSITSAGTWEKKTLSIAANTSLRFTADYGLSVGFLFNTGADVDDGTENTWMGSGGKYAAQAIANLGNAVNDYLHFTGVQLEVGSATPFEHRTIGDELARCQRYYQSAGTESGTTSYPSSSGYARGSQTFVTEFRATPSMTFTDASSGGSFASHTTTNKGFYVTYGSLSASQAGTFTWKGDAEI